MNQPKTYTVILTVKDDKGSTAVDTCEVTVVPRVKEVDTGVTFLGASCGMRVTYNWVGIDETGENCYIISQIEGYSHRVVGSYQLFVLFRERPPPSWPGIAWWVALPAPKDWTFRSPFTSLPERFFGKPLSATTSYTSSVGETFEGMGVRGWDRMMVIASGTAGFPYTYLNLGITGFDPDDPVSHLKPELFRGSDELMEVIKCLNVIYTTLSSPGELRIYDLENRVTGLVNGEVKEDIPYSFYVENTVIIFAPSGSYRYEVAGTCEGTYRLEITSVENGEASTLDLTNVPTSAGATHQYTIDWNPLSGGKEGVTMQIDSDGDGTFEKTVNLLTMEEITPLVRIIMPDLVVVETPHDLPEFVCIAERFEVRLMNVVPETPLELRIENSKFTRVWVDLKEARNNVTTTIEKLEEKPPELPDPPGLVWAYHQIDINVPEDAIENAEIDFWVSKEWLSTHGVSKEDVRLFRFGEGWEELTTEILGDDTTHVSYRAITPGFSVFAITAYTPAEAPPEGINVMLVGALVAVSVVIALVAALTRHRMRGGKGSKRAYRSRRPSQKGHLSRRRHQESHRKS